MKEEILKVESRKVWIIKKLKNNKMTREQAKRRTELYSALANEKIQFKRIFKKSYMGGGLM